MALQEGRRRHHRSGLGRRDHRARADQGRPQRRRARAGPDRAAARPPTSRTTTTSSATRSATSSSRTPPTRRGRCRHNLAENALPIRQLGSFLPGTGLGGAGVHWNGQTWRFHPRDFTAFTSTVDRYGKSAIPAGHDRSRTGASPTTSWSRTTTSSSTWRASPGRPGTSRAAHPRRQRLRGAALTRVPGASTGSDRAELVVPEGLSRPRLPPVPGAVGEPAGAVQEPRRRSPAVSARTAGSASGSAARSARRPTRR